MFKIVAIIATCHPITVLLANRKFPAPPPSRPSHGRGAVPMHNGTGGILPRGVKVTAAAASHS